MGKYLVLWEIDTTRVPTDPKERGTAWLGMADMTKQDMTSGVVKDWGIFPGELRGYAIDEGSEVDIMNVMAKYAPYVKFEVHPVASLAQAEEVIKTSMK